MPAEEITFAMGYHLKPHVPDRASRPENGLPRPAGGGSGRRSYSPGMGRWVSRDPLAELGDVNAYACLGNSLQDQVDLLGLLPCCDCNSQIAGQLEKDPELKDLYDRLKRDPVPGDLLQTKCLHDIYCLPCSSGHGSYTSVPLNRHGLHRFDIWVCCSDDPYTKNPGSPDSVQTLYHEMEHAAENCYGPKVSGCRDAVCAEARAYYCSGMSDDEARGSAPGSAARSWDECVGTSVPKLEEYAKQCALDPGSCHIQRPTNPGPE